MVGGDEDLCNPRGSSFIPLTSDGISRVLTLMQVRAGRQRMDQTFFKWDRICFRSRSTLTVGVRAGQRTDSHLDSRSRSYCRSCSMLNESDQWCHDIVNLAVDCYTSGRCQSVCGVSCLHGQSDDADRKAMPMIGYFLLRLSRSVFDRKDWALSRFRTEATLKIIRKIVRECQVRYFLNGERRWWK